MRWPLFERDYYWQGPSGSRYANRPSELSPEHYTLVTYWRPRWRWLERLTGWRPAYEN